MSVINLTLFIKFRLAIMALVGVVSFSAVADVKMIDIASTTQTLPLGLYKVINRVCYNPLKLSEDCTSTQYIELVKGHLYNLSPSQIAIITWMSEKPEVAEEYTYILFHLEDGGIKHNENIIYETPHSKAWLTMSASAISDYWYVQFDSDARKKIIKKTHLTLKPISRDAKINRLLEYPPPD